jgi:hypothetical protein
MDTCDPHFKPVKGWFNECKFPTSSEVLFIVQVIVILIVVITSIVNLSIQNGDTNMWTALLSCSIGYVLPNPKIKPNVQDENK